MPCLCRAFVFSLPRSLPFNPNSIGATLLIDSDKNYFELFELPQQFDVDQPLLKTRYRELQRTLHPDRFAQASERDQLLAVQYTATVNDAFATLKHPVLRALYMLKLHGVDLDIENATLHDPEFLMQQMELREALAEVRDKADPEAELERMARELKQQHKLMAADFVCALKNDDVGAARNAAIRMQFNDKMQREIIQLEDELLDF